MRLDNLTTRKKLGEGTFGEVFLMKSELDSSHVVVKKVSGWQDEVTTDPI